MMKSAFWDVMSEHTVRETAAFHSVLSIAGVMESYVNLWLDRDWLVNVCGILHLVDRASQHVRVTKPTGCTTFLQLTQLW
jgi:hypothetical protein